ncbi:hybrid sensor histidine kinase/response regulator [Cognatishimia activa]|uniref:histidine kinase n=1 Tax=Cognatishimia activa TaxID=1715691 RepID=A0A0P1JA59_9RHOB|nr:ATP-binding protein [Cognatishimia activa]CUI76513.1 Sensory/regulatory protein RpfC [Cognatishimia activa]CUK26743.1 Sensory/regulatory protein RpfC [Cognatishimia activa]
MAMAFGATREKRKYNRWVANETMEDFALRFTARRARRWSYGRVANTALGSISFLALEAIGAAITLTYGFDIAIVAIMMVGAILFLTGLPISYYAARYGLDIDLLTRGAGFGYIGSTITSLIYASFTFIFFALEAAILALALEFCLRIPLFVGYVVSSLIVIPLVVHGFSKISTFQTWTQPLWVLLHIMPFVCLAFVGYDIDTWTGFSGPSDVPDASRLLMFGAASGVIFSLVAQIGEQVDFLRFLPEPKTPQERKKWWIALVAAGPGWSILGVLKMLAGSYLVTLAVREGVALEVAGDPTRMYYIAFDQFIGSPFLVLALTGVFVTLSQLKINVTNAYAGSIAWSNFFSRLTKTHPGRVVWLVFNVCIALMLMELGVFTGLEHVLGVYSHVAVAWIGALVADLVINKPLGLSPKGIEFRRAHLYDINPVGIGAMFAACILSFMAYSGLLGPLLEAFSSFVALGASFALAPVIAYVTKGKYYLVREAAPNLTGTQTCNVCEYSFDPEDMTNCPFHGGHVCSLCCTLETSCHDECRTEAGLKVNIQRWLFSYLPAPIAQLLMTRLAQFLLATLAISIAVGTLLLVIRNHEGEANFDAVLTVLYGSAVIVIGICVWMFLLIGESRKKATEEAERQTDRLLKEIRAHERTDRALQKAKEKAEAANSAKTRYMSGLSHELRTPLNAIYGFAQLLEKDSALGPWQSSLSSIRRSSEHLAGLIDGLLDISRIEAGRLEIMNDRINLVVFLSQVASIFEEEARNKGISFELKTHGNLPAFVKSDEKRLRQIIINLLSNAIRYTNNGSVRLNFSYRNEVAIIEVIDTGVGIASDHLESIWRPFERGERRGGQGSGLGLTITKLLVEVLGGDIGVESVQGKGSTFTVRLMLPSVTPSAFEPTMSESDSSTLPVTGYEGPRKTILVVDDDFNHLALIDSFLSGFGFVVLSAPTVDMAEAMLADANADIILLDIDMPGRDGWSFARQLRSSKHASTPIAMISGHAHEEGLHRSEIGLHDAFLAKPYNLDDLLLQIAELLKVKLVFKEAQDSDFHCLLTEEDTNRLIEFAQIGHVSALRKLLLELKIARTGPDRLMSEINSKLESFDMAGLVEILREHESHE